MTSNCLFFFVLRKLDNVTKSLITLEFKNSEVKQKELLHHKTKNRKTLLINGYDNFMVL